MNYTARATLSWVSTSAGGRKEVPTIAKYATVSRFKDPVSQKQISDWSMVVHFEEQPRHDQPSIVHVSFLSPEAPVELLVPGFAFELLEGSRVVAQGQIIP
jgi:hypothetical protein